MQNAFPLHKYIDRWMIGKWIDRYRIPHPLHGYIDRWMDRYVERDILVRWMDRYSMLFPP